MTLENLLKVSFALCILFLTGCSGGPEYLPVPSNAEVIVRADPERISKKIIADKIGDFKFEDLFKTGKEEDDKKKEDPLEELLNNPGEAGIDYLENIYAFRKNQRNFVVFTLDDSKAFTEAMKQKLSLTVFHAEKFNYATTHNFAAGWTKNICVLHIGDSLENISEISDLIHLKKEKTIFSKEYKSLEETDADLLVLANLKKLVSQQDGFSIPTVPIFHEGFTKGIINFEEGKLSMSFSEIFHPDFEVYLKEVSKDHLTGNSIASYPLKSGLYLDISLLNKVFADSIQSQSIVVKQELLNTFTGELYFDIQEFKEHVKTFTRIETDEEFNTIEVIDSTKVVYPAFYSRAYIKDSIQALQLLKGLAGKNLLEESAGKFTVSLVELPINISIHRNFISITNEGTSNATAVNKVSLPQATSFFILVNPTKFHPDYQQDVKDIKEASLVLSKDGQKKSILKFELLTNDSTQNSIFPLLDWIKEKGKKDKIG